MNHAPWVLATTGVIVLGGGTALTWYYASPSYTDVGYEPRQPVILNHKIHAGDLGMDCRFCHNTAERAAHAAIPTTGTCMACHVRLSLPQSVALAPLRKSWETRLPIPWVRVDQLPDFAHFDHSAHLAAGVACVTCHGRVDTMRDISTQRAFSMSWCLDCHRRPKPNLRPRNQVANMTYDPAKASYDPDQDPTRKRRVSPPLHCSGCHQ